MAKKKTRKKRTISAEHLAKLQEGRKQAQIYKQRMKQLSEHGFSDNVPMGYTERLLNSVRRKDRKK